MTGWILLGSSVFALFVLRVIFGAGYQDERSAERVDRCFCSYATLGHRTLRHMLLQHGYGST